MRGRLIFPLTVRIARLDTEGDATAGYYDDDFREPIKVDEDGSGIGREKRVELPEIRIRAQVERDRDELQRMTAGGDVPDSAIGLVVHVADLERAGLVDPLTGRIAIRKGDRIVQLIDSAGRPAVTFDLVPIYITHVNRLDGWLGGYSNLILLVAGERPSGVA